MEIYLLFLISGTFSVLIYEGNVFIYIEKNTKIRHKVDSRTYTGI